jgi:chitodextrinase
MSYRLRWLLPALAACAIVCGLAAPAQAQTCAATWSSTQVYTAGNQASLNGINYTANFWTQGNNPSTNNGGPGSGAPWTSNGSCSGSGGGGGGGGTCAAPWVSTQVYTGGMQASVSGINYQANFWTQGNNPSTSNGPAGSGAPWTNIGVCAACTVIPSVPGNLRASNPTSSSVDLVWNASTAGVGCSIQYRIFVNGTQNTTATGTSATVGGLASNTTFNFTVVATDQVGSSGSSNTASAKTLAGGGGGGTGRSAPYADITLGSGSQIVANAQAAHLKGVTLAFLIDAGCTASWSGLGNVSNATFPNGTTVKSAIDGLVNAGVSVIVSWGGANGSVLSSCGSASAAQAMYQSVFNAYPNISGQDFDIEGGVNTSILAAALKGLKAANPSKSVSLTLPVLPTGLVAAGMAIVNACHASPNNFHPDTINVMAMDYGSANDNGGNMLLSAQQAAVATHNQTGDNIGVTPMIGVNDTNTEIFHIDDATNFVTWAKGQGFINRLAFWSLARDNGGCPNAGFASATCSGLAQTTWQFSGIFAGF